MVEDGVVNAERLHLGLRRAGDIGELRELFDGDVDDCDWITR